MKRVFLITFLAVLALSSTACAGNNNVSNSILKASVQCEKSSFKYYFVLYSDGTLCCKYGGEKGKNLKDDEYINLIKEESVKLSEADKNTLTALGDSIYKNKDRESIDTLEAPVVFSVLYKDSEITAPVDEVNSDAVMYDLYSKLIELSPLNVKLKYSNAAGMDLENSAWISENPKIKMKVTDDTEPEFNVEITDVTGEVKKGKISFESCRGNFEDNTYKCESEFIVSDTGYYGTESPQTEITDMLSGNAEYTEDEIILDVCGNDRLFNYKYETIVLKRVK